LHEACLGDHVACARTLLEAGANVSTPFETLTISYLLTKRIKQSSHFAFLSFLIGSIQK
jgi:hypothetical protein